MWWCRAIVLTVLLAVVPRQADSLHSDYGPWFQATEGEVWPMPFRRVVKEDYYLLRLFDFRIRVGRIPDVTRVMFLARERGLLRLRLRTLYNRSGENGGFSPLRRTSVIFNSIAVIARRSYSRAMHVASRSNEASSGPRRRRRRSSTRPRSLVHEP